MSNDKPHFIEVGDADDIGANRENGNFRTLSVLCQVEVVEVDAAASENAEIDPNLTWGE